MGWLQEGPHGAQEFILCPTVRDGCWIASGFNPDGQPLCSHAIWLCLVRKASFIAAFLCKSSNYLKFIISFVTPPIISYIIPTTSKGSFSWSLRIKVYFHYKLFLSLILQIYLLTSRSAPSTWQLTPGIFQLEFSRFHTPFVCGRKNIRWKAYTSNSFLLFKSGFLIKLRGLLVQVLGTTLSPGSLLTLFSTAGESDAGGSRPHTLTNSASGKQSNQTYAHRCYIVV